jgi:hypothetical protein
MKKRAASKRWPVYPDWSDRCDHLHGTPLNDAFKQYVGEFSSIEMFRRQIESELQTLPKIEQKQLWNIYWKKVRFKQTSFAQRVVNDHYYATGIRFPYAENPVREHIPPELWPDFKINHEKNAVEAKLKDLGVQRITYVQVLVSAHFWHSTEYDRVAIRNLQFRLNKTQAKIVSLLHQALKAGNQEGLFAKQLLADVGKGSGDIGDYFKDQELWRFLILKTSPGRYRLNSDHF